jgi:hypothetical protein
MGNQGHKRSRKPGSQEKKFGRRKTEIKNGAQDGRN